MNNKSLLGLDERVVAALSYLFGSLSGIIVLVLERDNKYVRFHALQSTLWFLLLAGVFFILSLITNLPIIGWLLGFAISPILGLHGIIMLVSRICLIFMAYTGKDFKIPIIGDVAWHQIYK